ncbi:hypothetical protein IAU60_003263 [Kwoniella sp. DSM 27419]
MRLTRHLQKLAASNAKAGSSRAPLIARHASTSASASEERASSSASSSFHPENLLGSVASPVMPTSASLRRPVPSVHFFDPSSPRSSQRAVPLPEPTAREADVVRELKEMLAQSHTARDEVFAARVWQNYNSLSSSYRRSLDPAFLQNIFRYVLPNSKYMNSAVQPPKGLSPAQLRSRLSRSSDLGAKWERRLRTVAGDMMASSAAAIDPQIFIGALKKLAHVGDREGCEAIIREIRYRYEDQLSFHQLRVMYTHALRSVSRWLRNNAHRHKTAQVEIMGAVDTSRRLILAMQEKGISPNATTAENLLNIGRLVSSSVTDAATVEAFDKLSEVILTNGYSMDIANLAFGPESTTLKPSVKLAVIDLLGRRGRLYDMLAAFDALFPGDVDRLPLRAAEDALVEEEEEVPTLSALMAAEQAGRAERGWFGQRVKGEGLATAEATDPVEAEEVSSHRRFSDYLPRIPTPLDTLRLDTAGTDNALPAGTLDRLTDPSSFRSARPAEGEGAVVSSVLAMLSRAWLSKINTTPNDTTYKDISLHVLRIALRAAHVEQARWMYSLSGAPPVTGAQLELPSLRAEPNWFLAAWRTLRWTRSSDRRGRVAARAIMVELEGARERIEQERAVLGGLLAEVTVGPEQPSVVNEAGPSSVSAEGYATTSTAAAAEATVAPFDLHAHLAQLDTLHTALSDIQQTIHANVEVATAKKARSNAARVVKLAERKEMAENAAQNKSRRRSRAGSVAQPLDQTRRVERGWEGQAALA